MTARLTPSQQRVVDAMRNGAILSEVHDCTHEPDSLSLRYELVDRNGLASGVHSHVGAGLIEDGIVTVRATHRSALMVLYVLAPAYQEAGE